MNTNKKTLSTGEIGIIILVVALVTAVFAVAFSQALHPQVTNAAIATVEAPYVTNAATSSWVTVGPQQNVQVRATTTPSQRRIYLYVASNGEGNAPVYCAYDGDNLAVVGNGIKISTSTSNVFTIGVDKGFIYNGAVRCTSSASSTLSVTEYTINS